MADRFTLGPWQVNVPLDTVSAAGAEHKLEPRSMRLLVLLAQAGGELVSADALLAGVWPGLVVTPSSLYDAVAQLRKVLGPEHIATVARKGYRLVRFSLRNDSASGRPCAPNGSTATERWPRRGCSACTIGTGAWAHCAGVTSR
jgi:DNA-binding winged helix-turn-helix (wHTH) protein